MQAESARHYRSADVPRPSAEYVKDSELNLLWRPGFAGNRYSDGADAERRILAAVCSARDRSTFSAELAGAISEWPSEYHLSRERHCVVRPLGIEAGDRVLEFGCGCGAITRYLGEIGAQVTALEAAPLRARTAAERCRDLPNVTIVADDFLHYASAERFDWVLLIGVLEYAALTSDEADPVARVLGAAAAHLAPDGRLVIAIENKLGLKYFNGCAEDHIGAPFHGVQGLYEPRAPRTFGRQELARHVRNAGLSDLAFHYPFPDYKLPRVVLTERGMLDTEFDAAGLLACLHARDYSGNPHRIFSEPLVAREAARNGLLEDLSNSFLVVAGEQNFADETLATVFAVQRNAAFATETCFMRDGATIRVHKRRLFPEQGARQRLADGCVLEHVAEDRAYVPGRLTVERLTLARAKGGDLAAIVDALMPWFDVLLSRARAKPGQLLASLALPRGLLDLTPFNLIETERGLVPIDMEWRLDHAVPLGWVVTRAVLHSLCGTPGFERQAMSIAQVVEALCARRALAVSRSEVDEWLAREADLYQVSLGHAGRPYTGAMLSKRTMPFAEQALEMARLKRTVSEIGALVEAIRGSRSWRYSYPIRLAGRFLRAKGGAVAPDGSAIASASGRFAMPGHGLPRREIKRYGAALAIVVATFAVTRLLVASGVHVPRMLLYIAAVAVTTRAFGSGPGLLAMAASVGAIVFASFHQLTHSIPFAERFATFLICAVIAILVSVPRAETRLSQRSPRQ